MLIIVYLWILILQRYSLSECNEIYRLPKNVQPYSYNLTIWLSKDWGNFSYQGQVHIDIRVVQVSNSITLNIDGLVISKESTILINSCNDQSKISSQIIDDKKQLLIIECHDNLNVGNYSLHLVFSGKIVDDVFGFYRSIYKNADEMRWIGVTQFSPIFARRVFPCFDEPSLKARFKLQFGHFGNQTITSNTEQEKSELTDTPNYFLTTMKRTPLMSTYLLGWAVHDFEQYHLSNSTSMRLWSRRKTLKQESLALTEGKLIYSALETMINVENPIKKLDHIAVPDFNFHAMENWGMITFRESVILLTSSETPTRIIQEGLSTVAHEYAHTWFGNLVTPEFWDVAWLKEGFATFLSYFSRSIIYPDFKIMDLFVVENLQDALYDDAQEHNRTMNGKKSGAAVDILGFLDFVSYKKGAAIVWMIQAIMGEQSFWMALNSYLTTRSYNFATPLILYRHLRKYTNISGISGAHIDIGEIIETYANEPGYPLITITRNYSNNLIVISQERFYLNSNLTSAMPLGWWIPLNLVSMSQKQSNFSEFGSIWLSPEDKKITINVDIDPIDWVICDINKAGYYRINYDLTNWFILIMHLDTWRFGGINHIARATLIDDAFNLARGGYINYKIPLHLTNYLRRENKYEPWMTAMKSLKFLHQVFQDLPILQSSIQKYVLRITEPIYQFLYFNENEEDKLHMKLLRNLILTTVCEFKNTECMKHATTIFQNWISNPSYKIKPNLKSVVYCEGIRASDSEQWEKIYQIFLNTESHIEKQLLLKGLGCTSNFTLINKLLHFSILHNGPELPKQDQLQVIVNIFDGGIENIHHTLNFICHNVKEIIQLRGHKFLQRIFSALKQRITSENHRQMLSSLADNNIDQLGSSLPSVRNVIKFSAHTIAWIEKYSPIILHVLETSEL